MGAPQSTTQNQGSAENEQGDPANEMSSEQQEVAGGLTTYQQDVTEKESTDDATGETTHFKVYRYDPDVEEKKEPRFDSFHVPYSKGMIVLDALIYARDTYDSSLTFRHSCRQAVCGSDAMFINGQQRLACKTQIADLDTPVRVEPLPHQLAVKDLVVEMDHFYKQMRAVEPYFQPDELPDGELEEQRQSPENREKIKMASRCIWCSACMSSCNIVQGDQYYLGPAPIVKGYRFYMDEREGEKAQEDRLETLSQEHGVWRCQTQFSCTGVCPKDIPITEYIQEMKREAVKNDLKFWE
jgi:succinate dehydrogenase / fumarate reductase iron-sulfur subunit